MTRETSPVPVPDAVRARLGRLMPHYLHCHCGIKMKGMASSARRARTKIGLEHQMVVMAQEIADKLESEAEIGNDEAGGFLAALTAGMREVQYKGDNFLIQEVEELLECTERVAAASAAPVSKAVPDGDDLRNRFLDLMAAFRRSVFADTRYGGTTPVHRIRELDQGGRLDRDTQRALDDELWVQGENGLCNMRAILRFIRDNYCGGEGDRAARAVLFRIRDNVALGPPAGNLLEDVEAQLAFLATPPEEPAAPAPAPEAHALVLDHDAADEPDAEEYVPTQRAYDYAAHVESKTQMLTASYFYDRVEHVDPDLSEWDLIRPITALGQPGFRRLATGRLVRVTVVPLAAMARPTSHDAQLLVAALLKSLPVALAAEVDCRPQGSDRITVLSVASLDVDRPVTALAWLYRACERGATDLLVVDTCGEDEVGRMRLLASFGKPDDDVIVL